MKKEKIITFIESLLANQNIDLDETSKDNYQILKHIIQNIDLVEINNFKYIVKRSESIINKMNQAYLSFNDSHFVFQKSDPVDYSTIRKELHGFPSYYESKGKLIKESIKQITQKFYYQLKIKDVVINLYFYDKSKNEVYFRNIGQLIYSFVTVFGVNLEVFNNYNIRLLLVDFPRRLDSKSQTTSNSFRNLSEEGLFNNSSGVNIFSKKELVVTRKSGLTGLLIHELIHMLGLDFCYNFTDNDHVNLANWKENWVKENNIKDKGNNIVSFIESICNTTSCYFLAIYNSIYLHHKLKTDSVNKYFKYFFYLETLYCYLNAIKLLGYFNFNDYDSFFNNKSNKVFYQNALVFEYIVLRMFIINNYYNLLLRKMIQYNFNELTDSTINLDIQYELNQNLLQLSREKTLRNIFDSISKALDQYVDRNNYMEYFLTTLW